MRERMHRTLRVRKEDRQLFDDVRTGRKSIETRAATAKYQNLAPGDTFTFVCGEERFTKEIREVFRWPSVEAMAKDVPFASVMPNAASLAEVKKTYASYPGYEAKIRAHGLIGFTFS